MRERIHIDEEFRDLLPTPSPESLQELEKSILAEGCRDPLVAWRDGGKLILLDGHSRHTICQVHKIECKVRVLSAKQIPDREAAKTWMLRNQLARRNLTPDQFTLFLGKLYNLLKQPHGGDRKSSGQNDHLIDGGQKPMGQNGPSLGSTAEQLAKAHGVSEATVRRAGRITEGKKPPKKSTPSGPTDADDKPIPEHLRSVFESQEQFKRFAQAISSLKGQVTKAINDDPVSWSQFNGNDFDAALDKAHDLLTLCRPNIVCVYCSGSNSKNCKACKGSGFLSKAKARCAAAELRHKKNNGGK